MKARGWRGRVRAGVALAGMSGALAWAGVASAQQPPAPPSPRAPDNARECRCLDESGRERERCFCVVMPEDVAGTMMGFGRRAVLGVNVRPDQPARYDEQGARLYGVSEDSPAGEAGLEEGDVVVALDGRSLTEPLADERAEDRLSDEGSRPVQRLMELLADREPGDSVRIDYLRDGARRTATVELEEPRLLRGGAGGFGFLPRGSFGRVPDVAGLPEMRMFGPGRGGAIALSAADACPSGGREGAGRARIMVGFGRSCVAGVELIEMSAGLAEYFGTEAGGVLVADAGEENPLGLRAGDVVIAVDGREVRGADHALRMLRSYDDDEEIDLRVRRRQETLELTGRLR